MNERQMIAYQKPAYRAEDTVRAEFMRFDFVFGTRVSSNLSLNK